MILTYRGLTAEGIAEVLRSLPFRHTIRMDYMSWCPSGKIRRDGINITGKDRYTEYLNAQYTGHHIGRDRLIRRLAGKTFTICA